MTLPMLMLEQRSFGLDDSLEVLLFECVMYNLRGNRIGKVIVDVMGCLNCVIHASSGDLPN